jgi:apolipoprotein N-acyltransferase
MRALIFAVRGWSGWRWWPWAAAVATGILTGLAYPPFGIEWIIWVALTPMIAAVWFAPAWRKHDWLRLFALGWVAGSAGFLLHLHWIIEVTVAGWVALSLYCGIYPGLAGVFFGTVGRPRQRTDAPRAVWVSSRSNLLFAAVGAMGWTATEYLRSVLFTGFGWNSLGVALWQNVPMLQITDLTGVWGLSFLIVAVNLMVVLTIKRLACEIGTGAMKPHYDFAITLAVVALVFTYGIRQLLRPAAESLPLRVAAVQPNIPQDQKWDPAYEQKILDRLERLSEAAIALNPDLLVWPEAATPRAVLQDPRSGAVVRRLAEMWDGDFLLGSVHFSPEGDFNSVFLFTDGVARQQMYHKIHLVPFGEYIPLRHSFPLFAWIVGDLVPEDFDAGTEFSVLEMAARPVRIAPLICFEDTLGPLARPFVLGGAQLFVVVTNDGWFRESAGSMQHLAQSVFRSAENKVPMLRVANTGVTAWIDPFGRVLEKLADAETGRTFIEGTLVNEFAVPVAVVPTFYTRHGDVFAWACLGGSVLWIVGRLMTRPRRRAAPL